MITITFYSNYLNHHQLPFCTELYNRFGEGFKFIATEPIKSGRIILGLNDMNKQYPFVLTTYDSEINKQEALRLCVDSDVTIMGSAPLIYTTTRLEKNKLTFKYSERYFKKGRWRALRPRAIVRFYKNDFRYRKNPNLRMLCAGAYVAPDCRFIRAYPEKMYKWGYFPEVIEYDIDQLMAKKHSDKIQVLWCGRFLGWKHPEKAIYAAKRLMKEGYNFELNIIGAGDLESKIKEMIRDSNLSDCVKILGSMSPEDVRKNMEKTNIYMFTSDRYEGWGAVLNEAMNSGCAVVANSLIGSVPFLIENGENGLIYKNNSSKDLYKKVKKLADDTVLVNKLGRNAYFTIRNTWNAGIASERFIKVVEQLLENKELFYKDGPCSVAETRV